MQFRHPGLGWVRFWIPHSETETMIDLLQRYGLTPAEAPPPPQTN